MTADKSLVSSSAVQVAVWPEAFAPRCEIHSAPAGANVAELVALACRAGTLDPHDTPRARLYIDGRELELRECLDLIPSAGSIVNLNVTVHGSSARTFTQLFFAIASVAVTFFAGPIWGAVVAMAGSVVDYLVFNKTPDSLSANDGGALSDISNEYRRRESFPLVLGKQRVGFDVAALPYTQNVGSEVWLHAIFGVHYGACDISELKLGETLLSDYPASDYQIEVCDRPGPRNLTLYPGRVHQDSFNVELDFAGSGVWEVQTFQAASISGQIDITLPQGLMFRNASGKIRNEEVRGRIELAEVGSESWTPAPLGTYRDKDNHVLPAGDWYVNARSADPVRLTFGFNLDPAKHWKARVKAWDMDGDYPSEDSHTWATYWTAIRSYAPGLPIVDETLSVIALRIKSSGDLNGSLPLFSGVVEPVVPIYSGGQWLDDPEDWQASSNAAALARWLCTGPAVAKKLSTSEINASFGTAYDLIETRSWHGAIDIRENEVTLADAIQALGRMGRFNCYWNGSELCLVSDWEKPVPRQLFTGKNAEGYRYRRTFRPSPHGVFVEFKNLDVDSETAEVIVYSDGYNAGNAEEFAALRLDFACTAERAFREGRVYLAKLIHQAESHEWTAGIESIVSAFGDRVLVRHATALYGRSEARVRNRHMAGALVHGFRLSDPVVIEVGKAYAVDIQRDDQVIRGVEVFAEQPGLVRDLYFAEPVVASQAPKAGDLIAFGELGFVTEDLEIVDIQPDGPIASISAVRYAAVEIEAAETGPIPPLPNLLTPRVTAPRPRLLGDPQGSPDGVVIAFDIDPLRAGNVTGFVGRYRMTPTNTTDAAPWTSVAPLDAAARTFRTPPFSEAQSELGDADAVFAVDIELRTVLMNGDRSEVLQVLAIPIRRPVPVPVDFYAQGVVRTGPDGSSFSALHVGCDPVDAGIVQTLQVEIAPDDGSGPDPSAWRAPGDGLPATNPDGDFLGVDGGAFYAVRGRWLTADQWPGAWVVLSGSGRVQVPANGNVASNTINVGNRSAGDLIDDVDELFEVYGDTIAAGAAAAAAAASAATAQAARDASQTAAANSAAAQALAESARNDAQTARTIALGAQAAASGSAGAAATAQGLAETARTQAQAANTAAGSARDTAIAQASAAAGSASTAAGHASTASSKADEAAGSASASQASAVVATSKAGEASGSASASASSASAAATSATAAGTSASAADSSRIAAETANASAAAWSASSAASASTAAGHASSASTSAGLAASSRDAASGSASAASSSASAAATSASAAGTSASAAESSRLAAETANAAAAAWSAAAATSASNAAGSASSASTSAGLSAGSAAAAGTSAGQAGTSATQAATSASNAAGSASSASASSSVSASAANSARLGAQLVFPSDLTLPDLWAGSDFDATNSGTPYTSANFGVDTVPVWFTPSGTTAVLASRQLLVPIEGRKYELTVIARRTVAPTNGVYGSTHPGMAYVTAGGANAIAGNAYDQSTWTPGVWQTLTSGIYNFPAGTRQVRPRLHVNWNNTGSPPFSDTVIQVKSYVFEDVTEKVAAAASASAAVTSASAAAASASAAGEQASAASLERVAAQTARSGAESARDSSAASATTAAGSAASSQTSATNAANSATASGNSATASANSASVASTKATEAGTYSASAASSAVQASASLYATGRLNLISRFDFIPGESAIAVISDSPGATGTWKVELTPGGGYAWASFAPLGMAANTTYTIRATAWSQYGGYLWADFQPDGLTGGDGPTITCLPGVYTTYAWTMSSPSASMNGAHFRWIANPGNPVFVFDSKIEVGSDASTYTASPRDGLGYANASSTSASTASAQATLSGDRAAAAETSRTLAETARGQAQTAATNAATSESNAAGSSSSATSAASTSASARDASIGARDASQSARDAALGYRDTAGGYASAASGSASSASASATAAGTSATAADTARTQAQTARSEALVYRDAAASSSTSAAGAASAASASAGLSARIGLGTLNTYPTFAIYPDPGSAGRIGIPDGYNPWSDARDQHRIAGRFSDWAMWQHNNQGGVTTQCGIVQDNTTTFALTGMSPGWYVLEADIRLLAGGLSGAGIFFYMQGTGGSTAGINFAADKDVNEVVNGNAGTVRAFSFRKLIYIENSGNGNGTFHLMTDWDGFSAPRIPKIIAWDRAAVRIATTPEIQAQRADANASTALANVGSESAARAAETAALATRASTTEAMLRTMPNLLPYSNFASGPRGWSSSNWDFATPPASNVGTYAVCSAAGAYGIQSGAFRLEPGVGYQFSFEGEGGSNPSAAAIYITEFEEDGTTVVRDGSGYANFSGAAWFNRKQGTYFVTLGATRKGKIYILKPDSTSYVAVTRIMVHTNAGPVAWNDDATAGALQARTSIVESSAVDSAAKLAIARLTLIAEATGGRPARMGLYSDNYGGSAIALDAAKIYFGDNTVFDDASDTLQSVTGSVRYVLAWGADFGADGLRQWMGPSGTALSAMSRANAYFYIASTSPYVGGTALPAGGSSAGTKNTGNVSVGANGGSTYLDFASVAAGGLMTFTIVGNGGGITAFDGSYEIYEQTTSDSGTAGTYVASGIWTKSGGEPAEFDIAESTVVTTGERRFRIILNNSGGFGGAVGLRFRADYVPPAA